MIRIYPASSRYSTDHGWLQSNFSFSFADYYDPDNMNFGVLRVFNDDIIQGKRGFGAHPHREMEIVSIVLKGQLKHEDSTGRSAVTTFGEVQRMSAGTGIIHSETNPGDEDVHLTQLWFMPEESGLTPSYETTEYDTSRMKNNLLPVVSKQSGEKIAHIHQDLTIYMSELDAGGTLAFEQKEGRRIYLFVIEGSLTLNGDTRMERRDAARIEDVTSLQIQSDGGSMFMLMDLP
jgi:redox-sensitive bicupin YhaK (pirin superfamily)